MTKEEAVQYFDGSLTVMGKALGLGKSAISNWGEYPPVGRQIQIQYVTDGFLKCETGIKLTETALERKRRRQMFRRWQKEQARVAA